MSIAAAPLQEVTLAELLDDGLFIDGDWVESKDQDAEGDVRLIQLADVGDGVFRDRSSRFLTPTKAKELRCTFLEPGDILVARMPEPLGRACIFPGIGQPAVTAVDICIVRPNRKRVHPQWLVKAINSPQFRESMQEFIRGTTRQRISRKNLGTLRLTVPEVDEQLAVAQSIERFQAMRGNAATHIQSAHHAVEHFRQAVLSTACSGGLTTAWREQNPDHEDAEKLIGQSTYSIAEPEEGLAELPDKWAWVALGNYAQCSRGRFSVRPRNDPSCFGGEHPFIQIGNLNPDGGWVRSHTQTLNAKGLSVSKKFPEGTAVIAIVGATIGNTGLLAYDMCFPDSLVGLETGTPEGNRYIELFLRNRKHAIRQASYSSGGQPNIKLESLNPYPLALPPLAEQREIVRRVDGLLHLADGLQDRIGAASKRVNRSSQAVLAKAFRGELVTPVEGVDGE